MLWLDEYERSARLAPGFLALIPISVIMIVFGIKQNVVVSGVFGALSLAGGPLLLAELVRYQGGKIQEGLWRKWRGAPTTRKLRLLEPGQNTAQRDVWRKAVETIAGVKLLNRTTEMRNPARADAQIEVGVGSVREKTRDKTKFPLVWIENKAYGFHRNLYGVRWIARGIALGGVVVMGGYLGWLSIHAPQDVVNPVNILGLIICAAWLVLWFLITSESRVKEAADKYAYQLLQAASMLAVASNDTDT